MNLPVNEHILELREVGFRYPDGSRGLENCSLAIKRGSRTAVLGANGAGKTTLFLHLNGIFRPQTGQVCCDGAPLDYSRHGLHRLRSRVGLVFQNPDAQLFSASVREDVSFGPMNLGFERKAVGERVEEALLAVGLDELAGKPVHNLSYGQKKRVCIAGVLAMRPEVMILDEPMAGLDVPMQVELHAILESLHASGMTIVIATHDLDFAYQWADSISIMLNGGCATTWGVKDLPGVLGELASHGLGIPRVAELYHALTSIGVLDIHRPVPRSHQGLVQQLAQAVANGKAL